MKKVICIDDSPGQNTKFSGPTPKCGDILTVNWEGDYFGIYTYCFVEYGDRYGYAASRFIPLSSISESEFVRNYNTEKV